VVAQRSKKIASEKAKVEPKFLNRSSSLMYPKSMDARTHAYRVQLRWHHTSSLEASTTSCC
jgi:hypothetical protein